MSFNFNRFLLITQDCQTLSPTLYIGLMVDFL